MGMVTDYLIEVIQRQVDDHGLVVSATRTSTTQRVAHSSVAPDTRVECYDGSFFALRYAIDDLMNGLNVPRLVIYVPLDPNATHHALVEIEVAGVIMRPGQQPPM